MRRPKTALALISSLVLALPAALAAQAISLPRQGDNQRGEVRQRIGLVEVSIEYSSTDVHAPDGSDRRGKIWGQLVPWGFTSLGFGTCDPNCPWRGGADENTVFSTSHDLEIEGQPLAAGRYGLHFVPGESEWTVIFSREADAWGSFFYDPTRDALRVTVKPEQRAYREWLAYDFTDRRPDRATVELQWEELGVPIRLSVPNPDEIYFTQVDRELRSAPGFDPANLTQAARYFAQRGIHLDAAESWAEAAVQRAFVGREDFDTLSTLALVKQAIGKGGEFDRAMERAIAHPTATPISVYGIARPLVKTQPTQALRVFELAATKFDGAWPLEVGLGRSHAALGDASRALAHLRKAVAQAPDDANRRNLERLIARLEAGDTAIN